ncbi:MAG: hypothetical protein UT34_C0001G0308 [candidate division WS6 bacterium GW2011_GWF2_39_15]|uniref:Pyridoxamine 5'-phosphate oxidase N-terminal domain-containing protein n=1 Tax=candidate division WS6 bacterium GW2011_GWF2_39_15 TaxID=1619100 RepID=A0A0G0MSZ1_9BACT|nr:MAG: hypothetical protein UT34_C0001G0308 [candidate division WS6 bacterium GW2011_GWF2_39_15]
MDSQELKSLVSNYLSTQKLMSLATFSDTPWIANLYYVHDSDLNLYFVSKAWREHSKAIDINPNVAVAIADSHQPIYLPQKGIQLHGTAQKIKSIKKLEWMFNMWNKLITEGQGEKMEDPKKFIDAAVSNVYKISPKRIKFFNTQLWPKEQFQILDLAD